MYLLSKPAYVTTSLLLTFFMFSGAASAQSGRGAMHGYVALQDVAYVDMARQKVPTKVELRGNTEFNKSVYTTQTDEHGSYDFKEVPMGEYVIRISRPGYRVYEAEIYIPSDFLCNLATMLKREGSKRAEGQKR
jgi:hypothetical protein